MGVSTEVCAEKGSPFPADPILDVTPTAAEAAVVTPAQAESSSESPKRQGSTVRKLFTLSATERPALTVSMVLRILGEVSGLVQPLLLAKAYDAVVENYGDDVAAPDTRDTVAWVFAWCLGLHVAGVLSGGIAGYVIGIAGERVVARLRCRLYGHLLSQEMGFFDQRKSGDLVSRLGADTLLVQQATTQSLNEAIVGCVKVLVAVVLMFIVSWELTLVLVGVLLFWVVLCCVPLMKHLSGQTRRYQAALASAAMVSTEALGAMRTVRSFAAEDVEVRKYDEHIGAPPAGSWWPPPGETTYRLGIAKALTMGLLGGSGFLLILGALNICLWVGFILITYQKLGFGRLSAFQSYQFQVGSPQPWCEQPWCEQYEGPRILPCHMCSSLPPFCTCRPPNPSCAHPQVVFGAGQFSSAATQLAQAIGGAAKVFELLDRTPRLSTTGGTIPSEPLVGRVTFRNVSFAYALPDVPSTPAPAAAPAAAEAPDGTPRYVLRGFDLDVPANSTAALVGASGCGKSTALALLLHLYEANSGVVSIDGHDVTKLDASWMRSQMAFVQQVRRCMRPSPNVMLLNGLLEIPPSD